MIERGWRAAQASLRASRTQQQASQQQADELDARADWETLLQRGEARLRGGGSAAKDEADKGRHVDFAEPRSVLGLPPRGRVSPRALEVAFRRELLAWHPDRNPEAATSAAERTRAILAAYRELRRESAGG